MQEKSPRSDSDKQMPDKIQNPLHMLHHFSPTTLTGTKSSSSLNLKNYMESYRLSVASGDSGGDLKRRMLTEKYVYLPEELVAEIFQILPVKSLLRFKAATKHFASLVTRPDFISAHLHNKFKKRMVLVVRRSTQIECTLSVHKLDWRHLDNNHSLIYPPMEIKSEPCHSGPLCTNVCYLSKYNGLSSRNGLVLLVDHGGISVCNPVLREIIVVPPCPFSDPLGYHGCDGNKIIVSAWGFGNESACDYYIVHIEVSMVKNKDSMKGHIFRSATRLWTEIQDNGAIFGWPMGQHLFFNDICHWHTKSLVLNQKDAILTFNVQNQIFNTIEYPVDLSGVISGVSPCLLTFEGFLAVVCRALGFNIRERYDIWMLTEYGVRDSWRKVYIIGPYEDIRPLCFAEHDIIIERRDGELGWTSVGSDEVQTIPIRGLKGSLRVSTHEESLVSVCIGASKQSGPEN